MAVRQYFEPPGPKERRRIRVATGVALVPALIGLAIVVIALEQQGLFDPLHWSILGEPDLIMSLSRGLGATLQVAAVSVVLSLAVGLTLALVRMSPRRWLSVPARIWIQGLRGIPELLLVFFIYLGVPALTNYSLSTFWALVIGLVLYESTSMAEVFRSGFLALPRGQTEAAQSLGMRTLKTLRYIQLPQVVRQVLPSLVSEMVRVTKASSLGFVIGYADLLLTGELAIEYLGGEYAAPIFSVVALIYLIICLGLSKLSSVLSERLR